ncbi:hypothetical protein N7381_04470 [Pseudomonas asiatica]|uniref:hypothetical protein n=1 Tax=Pseudomonas asiatica TaxID=2219225 RepID=UPI00244C64E4|nr:hypothetical protein [Pseudomonas asiatica]MDH0132490.1 hypothetical protein [Pseudomonas asiatica]
MTSNCSAWQEELVRSRKILIVGVLDSMRGHKLSGLTVTDLAKTICATIRAVEERDCHHAGRRYRPINSSTLLRGGGQYRQLLDSFLASKQSVLDGQNEKALNPAARRLIKSKDCEVSNLSAKLERAQKRVEFLMKKCEAEQRPLIAVDHAVDAMGRSAKALFDLLVGTGIFKLDESAGEVVFVSRARKVAISRQEIAPYLNWMKSQMRNLIDGDSPF